MIAYFFYISVISNITLNSSQLAKTLLAIFLIRCHVRMSGHFMQGNVCMNTNIYSKYSMDYPRVSVTEDRTKKYKH